MPKSLNKVFISIIIFFLLIGMISLYLVYENVKHETISNYGEILNLYTNKSAETLESFIHEYKSDLEFCASLQDVIYLNNSGKLILDNFYISRKEFISGITRIDKNGIIQYTSPFNSEVIGVDVSFQEHNLKIMETHKPVISDIFRAVQGYNTIALAYPIFDNKSQYFGTLSSLIPFRHISEKFISNLNLDNIASVNMISSSGSVIYNEDIKEIGKPIEQNQLSDLLKEIVTQQKHNSKGNGVFQTKLGNYVYAYSTIQFIDTFWIVTLSAPTEFALESMKNFQTNYILIVFSFGLAIFLSTVIFFRIRKKIELENYEKQKFFNLVSERTGQIIYDYNFSSGKISWFGAIDELTGFSKDEFSKFTIKDWKSIIHIDDAKLIKHFDELEIGKNYQNVQYRIRKSSGEFIYVEDRNVILEDSKKQSLKIIGTIKDINDQKEIESKLIEHKVELEKIVRERTEELQNLNKELEKDIEGRKKREHELQQAKDKAVSADKIKSDFLAQISHEIRTPISAILNFSELLFDELKNEKNETINIAYNSINIAGKRMIRTIDLILNVSEVQSNTYDFNPEKFDLYNDSLLPIVNEFKAAAKIKNLYLEIIKETNDSVTEKDLYSVTQIFANLIDNAIKFTPKGGIKIIVGRNEKLFVSIKDTGIGISEKYLPNLFEPFTQEETGYTRKFDGTGLGMSLVSRYCELNNLKISVTSKKNEGTNFLITF